MPDKSLLSLEESSGRAGSEAFSSLRFPSTARLPKENNEKELEEFAETLFSGNATAEQLDDLKERAQGFVTIKPEPGLCVKMKQSDGKKVFVNICKSPKVPSLAEDVSDEDLVEALRNSSVSFRVPMSIGDPHEELDNKSEICHVFDVAVNPSLFAKMEISELFYNFFVSIVMEALEEKHTLQLDRSSVIQLKGKNFLVRSRNNA